MTSILPGKALNISAQKKENTKWLQPKKEARTVEGAKVSQPAKRDEEVRAFQRMVAAARSGQARSANHHVVTFAGELDRRVVFNQATLWCLPRSSDSPMRTITKSCCLKAIVIFAVILINSNVVLLHTNDVSHEETLAEQAYAKAQGLRSQWRKESMLQAVEELERAKDLWKSSGNRINEAKVLKVIAEIFCVVSNYRKALGSSQESHRIFHSLNLKRDEADALTTLGIVYLLLGKTQQSLSVSQQALRISSLLRDPDLESQSLNNVAEASYFLGDFEASLSSAGRVISIWDNKSRKNEKELARAFSVMAWIYIDKDDTKKALECFDKGLQSWRAANDRQGEATAINSLGSLYAFSGNFQRGLELQKQAQTMYQEMGDLRGEADSDTKLGFTYFTLGEFDKALDYFEQALDIYRQLENGDLQGQTLSMIGDVYNVLDNYDLALEKYDAAIPLIKSAGDKLWMAFLLNSRGALFSRMRTKEQQALSSYRQALPIFHDLGNERWEANTLNGIGAVYYNLGQRDKALSAFEQALALTQKIKDQNGESLSLLNISRIQKDLGNLEKARGNVETALAINESLRTNVVSQQSRAAYFASTHQYYELYIDILMSLNKQQPQSNFDSLAFAASERSRARSLLELLNEARSNIHKGVNPQLLERERELRYQLSKLSERQMILLAGNTNKDEADRVAKQIDELSINYDEVRSQIRSASPRYAALTQPQLLTARDIQQRLLDKNSILLEYALGEHKSYLWALTSEELSSYELPGRQQIELVARRTYEMLTASQFIQGESTEERQSRLDNVNNELVAELRRLSDILIGPVAAKLGSRRLLIVADGALQYLPFQLLLAPQPSQGAGNLSAPGWLLEQHEIVNEPSASALALLQTDESTRKRPTRTVAVLADPVFEADDSRIKLIEKETASAQSTQTELRSSLRDVGITDGRIPRLPASREEADAIMAVTPWRSGLEATGFAASRETAMKPELGNYRIVHFATHGLLNNDHPELSGIVLSLFDSKGAPTNGFLRLHDIYNLRLPVDLVVLSACNTGLGKDLKGEGLIGLTRGFMYAGAASVVASLWKVDDEATAELMRYFYGFMLKDGLTPSEALRKAQLTMSMQKRWQSPYYWAGFVIQGQYNQKGFANGTPSTFSVLLATGLVASIIALSVLLLRRKRFHS